MNAMNEKRSAPISFRLDPSFQERLEELAQRHGVSVGQEAQRLVIDALSEPDRKAAEAVATAELQLQIEDLYTLLRIIRGDLSTSIAALLVRAGYEHSEDAAEQWVRENFPPTPPRST